LQERVFYRLTDKGKVLLFPVNPGGNLKTIV